MQYRKGYKYQLAADEHFMTRIKPGKDIVTQFIELYRNGHLIVKDGYAWDGPSGPTVDRPTNMRGSVGHDALCQLMRQRKLDICWLELANEYMGIWCKEDGMWKLWADLYVRELNNFGSFAANPKNAKTVYTIIGGKYVNA